MLKYIHGVVGVRSGGVKIMTNKGVPQGNISSPLLFDIATEALLEEAERVRL